MDKFMDFLNQTVRDTGKGIKGYIKSQLKLMIITFIILSIGFTIIGIPSPILISAGISLLDTLPVIGSGIIIIPWSIISFMLGNNEMGRNIAIIYIVLIIAKQILEPMIMGKEIGVRPIYTFASTVIGSIILGPIGVIIGPIIAIIISSIIRTRNKLDREK